MSIDTRAKLNAKVTYNKKAFIVKNCGAYVWTKVQIWLNYNEYAYKHSVNIEPNETVIMPFSDFEVSGNCLNVREETGARFDGRKTKQNGRIKHYFLNVNAEEGHNFYELYGNIVIAVFIKLYSKVYRVIKRHLHQRDPPKL